MPGRNAVIVSLPRPLLKDVERLAKKQRQTIEELVCIAVRRYVAERKTDETRWARLRAYGAKKAKALGARTPEEVEALVERLVAEHRQEVRAAKTTRRRR